MNRLQYFGCKTGRDRRVLLEQIIEMEDAKLFTGLNWLGE
jgi:hypothetical protein